MCLTEHTGKADDQTVSHPGTILEDSGQSNGGRGTLPPLAPANADRKLEGDGEAPCATHCRADADIWRLYLKETEAEDREVTELWNSSLDSLLVFVSQVALFLGNHIHPLVGRSLRRNFDRLLNRKS